MKQSFRQSCVAGLMVLVAMSYARAEAPATQPSVAQQIEPQQFMRFYDAGERGQSLQTAEVTYRNAAGQTVRLVGAIHIAEREYYDQLNTEFAADDAVLYELVKPKDAGVPTPGVEAPPSDNPISTVQHLMKDVLNLSFQLDVIDYTKPNFVHADLDKETFEKLQQERGETFEDMILKQLMQAFTQPQPQQADGQDAGPTIDQLVGALTRPDMEHQIKLIVAKQIDDMQKSGKGFDVMAGTVILGERNKAALKVLTDTLGQGKQRISIFYGAAHMPDLAEHLRAMGFTPVSCRWNTAWDLTIRADQPSAMEKLLGEAMKQLSSGDKGDSN
jgi:hypothetical protein